MGFWLSRAVWGWDGTCSETGGGVARDERRWGALDRRDRGPTPACRRWRTRGGALTRKCADRTEIPVRVVPWRPRPGAVPADHPRRAVRGPGRCVGVRPVRPRAHVRQDACHWFSRGDEGDQAQLSTALWAEQREGGEQPCEQDRPVVAGGARARCGRGGRRHLRGRIGRGRVTPVGGDRGAQRRVGRQHPAVAVAMAARRWPICSQAGRRAGRAVPRG